MIGHLPGRPVRYRWPVQALHHVHPTPYTPHNCFTEKRIKTSLKCEAVPGRARIRGSQTCVSLNSRLESIKDEEDTPEVAVHPHRARAPSRLAGGLSKEGDLSEDRGRASACNVTARYYLTKSVLEYVDGVLWNLTLAKRL